MTSILQALRSGWRHVAKAPGSSFLAVLALALGLGLTTAAFSLLDAVFLRGLPLEGAERLVRLERLDRKTAERSPATLRDFLDWRQRATALEELAAFRGVSLNLSGEGVFAERANGAFVSDNLFRAVDAQAFLGRTLAPGDGAAAAPPVAVLGYALWRNRFGGERAAIGKTVRVDGEMRTVVGVMPEGFGFPLRQEIWIPLSVEAIAGTPGETMPLQVFGKVRQGVSLEQARARLATLASSQGREGTPAGSASAIAATPYVEAYTEDLRPSLRILFAAAVGVLCIACLNVANLLLGRFVARRGDFAVRKALGLPRVSLVVEQQAEALLLGALGALAGLAVARAGVALYLWTVGGELPSYWMEVRFDGRVLLFAASVAMVAALLCGTLPALRASALDPALLLKDAARGLASLARGRLTRLLVVTQVALGVALLVATGLSVQSLHRLGTLDLGFSPAGVLAAQVSLPEIDYPSPESQVRFYDEAAHRFKGLAGISEVAWTSSVPGGRVGSVPFQVEGAPAMAGDPPHAAAAIVSPRFFEVLGRSLLAGRDFAASDTHASPAVAIVNESFARRFLPPGTDPLGQRIRWGFPDAPWMTVIGVAPDLLIGPVEGRTDAPAPALYTPLSQNPRAWTSLLVRTEGNPLRLAPDLRRTIAQVDSRLPLFWIDPLSKRIAESTETHRALATLISVLGLTALVLAALGIYGVMALAVGQRAPEFGLRLALGAVRQEILELVLKRAGGQVALGLLLGLPLAIVLCRWLASSLSGVRPLDPASFLAAAAVIVMAGLVASLVPALRAARSDPASTLRQG